MSNKIIIVDGARTPVGSFGSALKDVPAHELGAAAAKAALERSGVAADDIQEVVMGCVGQVGPDAYLARRVALAADLPTSVPALTVNRLCGSGLQAVWSAAQEMQWSGLDLTLAGGAENMSRVPFNDFNARDGYRLGNHTLVDGTLGLLTDPFYNIHMGVTAENVAERYHVTREEQDEFALESQRRAVTEAAAAAFAEEMISITTPGRKPVEVTTDEHPKPDTTLEKLAKLRPAFVKDGTVTAGNASGINDAGAAMVLASEKAVAERGLKGLVSIEEVVVAALEPEIMGYAPVPALAKLWERTGMVPADIDVFEVNEAFAAQAVAVVRDAKLDPERVNPYGGAIALGHPIGATAAILTLRAAKFLVREDKEHAVVTMCIGGGQALAALLRRY
ncbi:thiolase family protein [Granulicoccus phenolivorans]|uniref:thiolase family protein n=1 Tax=Granulicoccus phenolivorans TaxID=266854 RepID=UPI0004046891|nr:thiolase family protein [Granulicoccus phenolivorans]